MRAWLIRHGESESNAGGSSSFPGETPLTNLGWWQASQVAADLREPALIVTSPYKRAQQSAEPTRARFPHVPCEEWAVQEFTYLGDLRGRRMTRLDRLPYVEAYWKRADPFEVIGEAESFAGFLNRVTDFLKQLDTQDGPVAVFTHELFIQAVLWSIREQVSTVDSEVMRAFRRYADEAKVPNCAITEL